MDKKTIIVVCVTATLVGGGAFYGGMWYAQGKLSTQSSQNFQDIRNLSPEERQARFQQMGSTQRGPRGNGDAPTGEIIAQDDTSVTIKLRDGGSKIIFISDATEVSKSASGTKDDVVIGATVTAFGTQNQDGSISARSIQIRPTLP